MESFWTEERITQLRELHAQGHTGGEIAKELGATRNAITGKKMRLGLGNYTQKQTKYSTRHRGTGLIEYNTARRIKKNKKVISFVSEDQTTPLKIGFIDKRDNQCAWILDEKGGDGLALYCGHKTHDVLSYCFSHCCIMYPNFSCQSVLIAAE